MSYHLSQLIDPNKVFLINLKELDRRWDPQFYSEHFNFESFIKLSTIAKVSGGKRLPLKKDYSKEPTPFLYLRVADIQDSGIIDYPSLKSIDEETYNLLNRYEIVNGDLAISIAGSIGKVVVIKGIPQNKHLILTENCAKISPDNTVSVNYLELVLQLPIVQKQIELSYIQTTIPKLGLDRICNLMLPPIPSMFTQQHIVDLYHDVLLGITKKGQEADAILNSIDHFLLNYLGIELPIISTHLLDNRIFSTCFSDICGGRFDPKSVLLFGQHAKSVKYENVQLNQIAVIEKGTPITREAANNKGVYPVIAGGQTSPYNHDKFNYEGNVITVSASGAYSGYVAFHEGPIFASDCSVIFSKNNQFSTVFLFEVLKAQQSQIYLLQQGAGQPHVYPEDLGKLWIPIIPVSKQNELTNQIAALREQAKSLQDEARKELEQAKNKVESLILGLGV